MSKVFILSNGSSGLYVFRNELITALRKRFSIVTSSPESDYSQSLAALGCKVINTPIDRRGVNPVRDFSLLRHYFRLLRSEKPDLVITYTIKPNIYGGLVCRLLKIPYAANITGLGTAFQRDGMLKRLVTFMYKTALKRVKTVFFENSENMRVFQDEKIIKPSQCCLLNGAGVNLEHYSFTEYPVQTEPTRFLFVGRVMREKGMDELFSAMERLRSEGVNCTLDVVGIYEENYEPKIRAFEAEGWLHYHGYQNDVRPFIAASHCFVLPSWHEGMANTNLECAAMGRPLITSRIHGCMEAVEENKSGLLCEPQNADSLYKAMKRFSELSAEERAAMGRAGRAHMEKIFDKRKVVKATLKGLGL